MSDNGFRFRKQTIPLPPMGSQDRATLMNMLITNGMSKPIFFSLYPDSSDAALEQSHQMYCKLVSAPSLSTPYFNKYATSLDLEEV